MGAIGARQTAEACDQAGVEARRSGLCAAGPQRRPGGRLERLDAGRLSRPTA